MSEHDHRNDWTVFGAVALIALGLWLLLGRIDGPLFDAIGRALRFAFSIAWPLALIAAGVLLLVASRKGGWGAMHVRGKRLYRSRTDRMVGGVLGGLGAFLGIDSTWLRIGFVVLGILGNFFPALIVYLIAIIVIPEEPVTSPAAPEWPTGATTGTETVQTPPPAPPVPERPAAPEPPAPPQGQS